MYNVMMAIVTFFGLFILFLISAFIGRKFRQRQLAHSSLRSTKAVAIAESTVFALLGILVAGCFASAYDQYETYKTQTIQEANAIDTAYLRINLLAKSDQSAMRDCFKKYMDTRVTPHKILPSSLSATISMAKQTHQLQLELWEQAIDACQKTDDPVVVTPLVINAINNMFEITNNQLQILRIHPPAIIMGLLIALAALSAFLAGYSSPASKISSSIHILSYVVITAFVIYVIIDLETPSFGLISIETFNYILDEVNKQML